MEPPADTRAGKFDESDDDNDRPELTPLSPLTEGGQDEICPQYESAERDYAPVQTAGDALPSSVYELSWLAPALATKYRRFSGAIDHAAEHEGVDYIHNNRNVSEVSVGAAADGKVVYVRTGCPQSRMFRSNRASRECGSGWGNHVIVQHLPTVFTRYAHLVPQTITVRVGEQVAAGDRLGLMGNTGRSEVRHLHLELGVTTHTFNTCGASQSFERVYDPSLVGL